MVGRRNLNHRNEERTITRPKRNDETINLTKQELLRVLSEDDALKKLMQKLLQEVLEAQMDEALLAGKGERAAGRLGYRSGHYTRSLITRVGKLELRVPPATGAYLAAWRSERRRREAAKARAAMPPKAANEEGSGIELAVTPSQPVPVKEDNS